MHHVVYYSMCTCVCSVSVLWLYRIDPVCVVAEYNVVKLYSNPIQSQFVTQKDVTSAYQRHAGIQCFIDTA